MKLIHCDNTPVVEIIIKNTSEAKLIMPFLVRTAIPVLTRNNIKLNTKHRPGLDNKI